MAGRTRRSAVSGVPEDLRKARSFLAYLQLLADADQDGDFQDHTYDPGAFVPTDDSILMQGEADKPKPAPEPIEPKADEPKLDPTPPIDPIDVEPAVALEPEHEPAGEPTQVAAATQVETVPTANRAPEPAVPLAEQALDTVDQVDEEPVDADQDNAAEGELIELHQSAPSLESVLTETAEAPEEEEVPQDEPSLSDLVAFARALAKSDPLEAGVEAISLRRILRGLRADADLVEAIGMGEHDRARQLLASGHRTLRTLVGAMDNGLRAQQSAPASGTNQDETIVSRLGELLQSGSAGLTGLHEEIYRQAMTARALMDAALAAEDTFYETEPALLGQISAVDGCVALITRFHLARADSPAKRRDNDTKRDAAVAQMRSGTESVDGSHAVMLSAQETVRSKNEALQVLRLKMRAKVRLAKDTITKMRAQMGAAQLLGTRIPQDLTERFTAVSEPVEMAIQLWNRSSQHPAIPEMELGTLDALSRHEEAKTKVIGIMNAPDSAFAQRDTREEELRKLLLVTMLLIIPNKTQKTGSGKDVPHRGYKLNHFFEAMREAGFISQAECNDFDGIKDWARLGNTTKKAPRPKYIKGWGRGTSGKRWHSWNLREEGQELAKEHLATLTDVSGFSRTIKRAFKRVLPNYWSD
jgi:hypothetical protein